MEVTFNRDTAKCLERTKHLSRDNKSLETDFPASFTVMQPSLSYPKNAHLLVGEPNTVAVQPVAGTAKRKPTILCIHSAKLANGSELQILLAEYPCRQMQTQVISQSCRVFEEEVMEK